MVQISEMIATMCFDVIVGSNVATDYCNFVSTNFGTVVPLIRVKLSTAKRSTILCLCGIVRSDI